MNNTNSDQSPLERLVKAAQQKQKEESNENHQLPVKVEPKKRNNLSAKVLTPTVEDEITLFDHNSLEIPQAPELGSAGGVVIANSSLTLNLNFNIDDKAVDRAIKTSKQVAKGIAAAGAAMLGTAFLLNDAKKGVDKVKIPLTPNPKLPNLNKKPR